MKKLLISNDQGNISTYCRKNLFKFILSCLILFSPLSIAQDEVDYGFDDKHYLNGYNIRKYSDFLFAARQWDEKALYKEGVAYYKGRGDGYDDIARAHILFTLASNKGHIYSSVYLGTMFENGTLGDKDYKLAEKYYSRAAQGGYKEAITKLAAWYKTGIVKDGKKIINPNPNLSQQFTRMTEKANQ